MDNNEQNRGETYFQNIKEYVMQIRTLYRAGVCIPSLLSPLSLIEQITDIYLYLGGGSILFLILLYHYKHKTKMVCNNLIILAILNNTISLSIIFNLHKIQLWLCILTCILALYVSFKDEIVGCVKNRIISN